MAALFRIHFRDNVAVALRDIREGEAVFFENGVLKARQDIGKGHKIAIRDIFSGENVIKYGFAIGHAAADIHIGDWIHSHNLKTNLGEILEYHYQPAKIKEQQPAGDPFFQGYRRPDGRVGTRNEIWVIPTVSCVNRNARLIADGAVKRFAGCSNIDGIYEITHPYGCSQLGRDQANTQRILADLVNHPNAGGVLVLGLGCENNNISEFKQALGEYDANRVKFLSAQDVADEIETGIGLVGEIAAYVSRFVREDCPVSRLVIGLKCGGSDGFSGITANPLVGALSDRLIAAGGSSVLTEVPEMFGAETILMNRAVDETVFRKTVGLVNDFKQYFKDHNQPIYENPSPGNKKGGITTLEEKSLGCTQKGGISPVVDVLAYGDTVQINGLNLLSAPGNDMVASTALAAAGCQIVLFTTGRGTPLGTVVPTVKIATNDDIFSRKSSWMDFNAGSLLAGIPPEQAMEKLLNHIVRVASGELTKSEILGFREIAIFKNGVTL
ncbi:MAG: altronate dehydratase family protein [Veillonellales bacterium]